MVQLFLLVVLSSIVIGAVLLIYIIAEHLFYKYLNLKVKRFVLHTMILLQPFILLTMGIFLLTVNIPKNQQKPIDLTDVNLYSHQIMENSNKETLKINNVENINTLVVYSSFAKLIHYLAYIWFIGAMFLVVRKIGWYSKFKNILIKNGYSIVNNEETKLKIYKSNYITSPFLTGFFYPIIIIPNTVLDEFELSLIIKHEEAHFQNRDVQFKIILEILKSINWFNPSYSVMQKKFNSISELITDHAVTENLTKFQCKKYGMLILKFAEEFKFSKNHKIRGGFYSYLSEDAKNLTTRLEFIMKKNKEKKVSRFTIITVVAVVMLIVGVGIYSTSVNYANALELHKKVEANASKTVGNLIYDDGKVQIFDGSVDENVPIGLAKSEENQLEQGNKIEQGNTIRDTKNLFEESEQIKKTLLDKKEYRSDANLGDSISSLCDGTVMSAEFETGYGNCVAIKDKDGMVWKYGFCSELLVNAGDEISEGTVIAYAGHSGYAEKDSVIVKIIEK